MRTLVVGDIHLKLANEELVKSLFNGIGECVVDNKVSRVVFLGDMYNQRALIHTSLQRTLIECLEVLLSKNSDLTIDILVGNHDLDALQSGAGNSLEVLPLLFGARLRLHSKPYYSTITKEMFLPYQKDYAPLQKFISDNKPEIVFTHLPIRGFILAPNVFDKDGVPQTWFNKAIKVFAGHFHAHQERGNILFTGSPLVHSFAEAGVKPIMTLWDGQQTQNISVSALVPEIPLYYIITIKDVDLIEIIPKKVGHYKFIIERPTLSECIDAKRLVDIHMDGTHTMSLRYQYITEKVDKERLPENTSLEDMLTQYISNYATYIKKGRKESVLQKGMQYLRDHHAKL